MIVIIYSIQSLSWDYSGLQRGVVFKRLRRTSESNTEIYRGIHYNIYSP